MFGRRRIRPARPSRRPRSRAGKHPPGLRDRVVDRRDHARLDLAMTSEGILVVSHDSRLNPDHTRGPDGTFLAAEGPAIRSLTLGELQRYDVGRLKPGTAYAATFPEQRGMDGVRIPTLME